MTISVIMCVPLFLIELLLLWFYTTQLFGGQEPKWKKRSDMNMKTGSTNERERERKREQSET